MIGELALMWTLAYAAAAVVIARAAGRARARGQKTAAPRPTVSVLVAARNEEVRLPACLLALKRQSYPRDRIEVIVADDHSTDGTAAVAERFGVRCVRLTGDAPSGKAAALDAAYRASMGDVLAITDADCRPPADWVRNLADQFDDPQAGMVCGVTSVLHRRLIDRIQALDWTYLLTIAAGCSALGRPITAMGNNMAVRREAFEAVGGYDGVPESVTEDYALLRTVRERTRYAVRLLLDRQLINYTEPEPTLRAVFAQRRRWGRGGLRASPAAYVFYLFAWSVHAFICTALVVQPLSGLAALGIKSLADVRVMRTAAHELDLRGTWRAFPAFAVYVLVYVTLLPLSLLLAPSVTWRGRRHA